MVDILKHVGEADWYREILNMSVNTPASWSAHALRTRLGMPSGPAALRGLTCLNVFLTSATEDEIHIYKAETITKEKCLEM